MTPLHVLAASRVADELVSASEAISPLGLLLVRVHLEDVDIVS